MKRCSLLILLLLKHLHGVSWFRSWSQIRPVAFHCHSQPPICPHRVLSLSCCVNSHIRLLCLLICPQGSPSLSLHPVFDHNAFSNFPQLTRILLKFKTYSNSYFPNRHSSRRRWLSPLSPIVLTVGCHGLRSLFCLQPEALPSAGEAVRVSLFLVPSAFTSNLHIGHRFVSSFIVCKCP